MWKLLLLLLCVPVQAATVLITWDYTGNEAISAQTITVLGETLPLGPEAREYTLLDQPAGDYTVSVAACNELDECSDPPTTTNYNIPDVPRVDDLILNVVVTKG